MRGVFPFFLCVFVFHLPTTFSLTKVFLVKVVTEVQKISLLSLSFLSHYFSLSFHTHYYYFLRSKKNNPHTEQKKGNNHHQQQRH